MNQQRSVKSAIAGLKNEFTKRMSESKYYGQLKSIREIFGANNSEEIKYKKLLGP